MKENTDKHLCLSSQTDIVSDGNMKDSDAVNQTEDGVMKIMMEFFADEMLPVFGITKKVKSFTITEAVELDLKHGLQDFNLELEDNSIAHFEFQSTNGGTKDLRRFRAYESDISYMLQKPVTTYVLFSGKIKDPMCDITDGINTYKIQPIIMSQRNADIILENLQRKLENGEMLSRDDLVVLPLLPVCGGESTQLERIQAAFKLTAKADEVPKEDIDRIEAAVYAMATKFLNHSELEQIKGGVKMTYLGQLLVEDGRKEGREEGREEGLEQTAIRMYNKGFSPESIADILDRSISQINKWLGLEKPQLAQNQQ